MFDKAHRTPLHIACLRTDYRAIDYIANLCHVGASLFEKAYNGETSFSLAMERKDHFIAGSFFMSTGHKTWSEWFKVSIDEDKLLSHLLALPDDTISWLCSVRYWEPLGLVMPSDRNFQNKPLILHVLDHGHVGLLVALLIGRGKG